MTFEETVVSVCLALVLGAGLVACGAPEPPERIVLVVVDTLRRDALGCYGGEMETPAVDRLAREGQLFSHAVASFHQTTMSMGALFTGRTPSLESGDVAAPISFDGLTWCGLARFDPENEREECIPRGVETLGEKMSAAGYATIGVASNALLFDPYGLSRGFDDWTEVGDVPKHATKGPTQSALGTRTAERVNAAAAAALARRPNDRFFLYVHYMDVHDHYWARTAGPKRAETSTAKYRKTVGEVDRALAELLAMLEAEGLLEDAVVVFTSDHGERLGEEHLLDGWPAHWGNPSFEEVLEVPLVVWPARFDAATALVRGTDLFGMLVDLAGTSRLGESELQPDEIFTSELGWLTYRRGRFKSYTRRGERGLWLTDLESDEDERRNVAFDRPEIALRHWNRIDALARELAVPTSIPRGLTEIDRARLRALGYLEPEETPKPHDGGSPRRGVRRLERDPDAEGPGAEPWRPQPR